MGVQNGCNVNILVVDDDADSCEVLSRILGLHGHETDCAYTFKEALTLARRKVYEVIVADVTLPDGNGIALAKALRSSSTKVVALTGQSPKDLPVDAFDAVMQKPADMTTITQVISQVTGK